jgi:hypothetical protein
MTSLLTNKGLRVSLISSLLALTFGLSARGAIYSYDFSGDFGLIPHEQDDYLPFFVEHEISGVADPTITSFQIVLTFNDNYSLSGNSSGIQGLLTLGTLDTSPYVSFYAVDNSGSGSHIYTATFSGDPGTYPDASLGFNGLNPNETWSLVLWDNSSPSPSENALVGWSLEVTAVPEPINIALGVFAALAGAVGGWRWVLRRRSADRITCVTSQ